MWDNGDVINRGGDITNDSRRLHETTYQHVLGLFPSSGDGSVREIITHQQMKSSFLDLCYISEMSRSTCLRTGPHFSLQNARFVCGFGLNRLDRLMHPWFFWRSGGVF